jgi:hypothetical protein
MRKRKRKREREREKEKKESDGIVVPRSCMYDCLDLGLMWTKVENRHPARGNHKDLVADSYQAASCYYPAVNHLKYSRLTQMSLRHSKENEMIFFGGLRLNHMTTND